MTAKIIKHLAIILYAITQLGYWSDSISIRQ